jgi:putative lipoic acid-binding regulatory protein
MKNGQRLKKSSTAVPRNFCSNPSNSRRLRPESVRKIASPRKTLPMKPFPATAPSHTESLIEYPCLFPIKVMGLKVDTLVHTITLIAHQFDPTFDAATIELRESKGGKYLSVTITVTATSREQLDELYRTLSTHPMIQYVL